MQLAYSTLACPAWTLEQVVRAAVDYGYAGVEIRGLGPHVDLREAPELARARRGDVRARFADSGLAICGLGSSARFADPAVRAQSRDELRDYIELAADLGCPLVRVFGGAIPDGLGRDAAARAIAEELDAMAPFARQHGVGLVLETHDAFSTGQDVAAVLEQTHSGDVLGAVWDVHHPFVNGESIYDTHRHLRPYLRHLHLKDTRRDAYCLLGTGEVPIAEILRLIVSPDEGDEALPPPAFASVEWEKRWIPGLAEPEEALPQYASVLRTYLAALD